MCLPSKTRCSWAMPVFSGAVLVLALVTSQLRADDLATDFANPPAQWKSRPLWFWNGPLTEDTTTEIMQKSVASGYYGFGILPTQEMGVEFMSPEFLHHYKHAVETAARLGLKMCLYDEFWFPSGSAGGLLKQKHPEALEQAAGQSRKTSFWSCDRQP